MEEKNLQLERTVFFCDAVVAIAITLLALDIKMPHMASGHITFQDILGQWKTFSAFLLSYINIANFWKTHHMFFANIKKMDDKLLWYNIIWLLFIILLPFSTSLVSSYFFDTPAIFVYSLNILLISICQNMIWDYSSGKTDFMKKDGLDETWIKWVSLFCNLDMVNGLFAIILSFFYPALAFILLFTKLPMLLIVSFAYRKPFKEIRRDMRRGKTKD